MLGQRSHIWVIFKGAKADWYGQHSGLSSLGKQWPEEMSLRTRSILGRRMMDRLSVYGLPGSNLYAPNVMLLSEGIECRQHPGR